MLEPLIEREIEFAPAVIQLVDRVERPPFFEVTVTRDRGVVAQVGERRVRQVALRAVIAVRVRAQIRHRERRQPDRVRVVDRRKTRRRRRVGRLPRYGDGVGLLGRPVLRCNLHGDDVVGTQLQVHRAVGVHRAVQLDHRRGVGVEGSCGYSRLACSGGSHVHFVGSVERLPKGYATQFQAAQLGFATRRARAEHDESVFRSVDAVRSPHLPFGRCFGKRAV